MIAIKRPLFPSWAFLSFWFKLRPGGGHSSLPVALRLGLGKHAVVAASDDDVRVLFGGRDLVVEVDLVEVAEVRRRAGEPEASE